MIHEQSCCFALSSYCFFTISSPPPHLKLPIIYDTLWSVRNRIFSVQNELFLLIASERFFDSSVVPSFLVRKVENGSFPCTHKRGERTGQLWRHNTRRARTHENNSRETGCRLGTIIQSIFCAQSGASIHLTVWKWSGESRYPGALPPVLENFRRAFSPGSTDCPWVSEDGGIWNLGNFFLLQSGTLGFGIRNTAQGILNVTTDCNPKSKFA